MSDELNARIPTLPTQYSMPKPAIVTTYFLNETNMTALRTRLMTDNFVQNIVQMVEKPIDNILSCRVYPFNIRQLFLDAGYPSGQGASSIQINKFYMGPTTTLTAVLGHHFNLPISSVDWDGITPLVDFGSMFAAFDGDSFLDYAPYTKITLYLPYLGTVDVDPAEVAGNKTIYLKYAIDFYTGDCTAFLYGGVHNTIIATKSGKIGYEVPITGGREAQTTTNLVSTALTAAASIGAMALTKNPAPAAILGTVASTAGGVMGALNTRVERTGQLTQATSFYAPQEAYFVVEKAQSALPADPSVFNATVGRACCKTGTLSTFHGFTKCSAFHLDGFLNALDSELEEIDSLLRSGIILPASE